MQFASPYFLWLLAVIPLMVVYYVWRTRQGGASIQVSTIDGVAEAPRTVRYYLRHLPFALRCAAESVDRFLASRFVTTVAFAAVLVGAGSMMG